MTRIIGPFPTEGEAIYAALAASVSLPLHVDGRGTSRSYDVFPVNLSSIIKSGEYYAAVPVTDWYAVIYSFTCCCDHAEPGSQQ